MDVLLDTHTFLWYLQDSKELSSKAAEILEDPSNNLWLSIASLMNHSLVLISCDLAFDAYDLQRVWS